MAERGDPSSKQENAADHTRRKDSGQQNARPQPPLEKQPHHTERHPITHKRGCQDAGTSRVAPPKPEADQ